VYLTGKLVIDAPVAGVGASWRFSGPSENATVAGSGAGANTGVHSASAMISRLTVSNGSQQISQIQNYNVYHDMLLSHAGSASYTTMDSAVYEFAGITRSVTVPGPSPAELTINFAIPLISGLWSGETAVPLYLLSAPLSVEILTNSITDSFVTNNLPINNFTLSNLQLCYEEIQVGAELKNAVMDRLKQGQVWRQYMDSVYTLNTSADQGTAFNIGTGMSSLKAILYADRQPAAGRASAIVNTGDLILNGFSNCRFNLDGRNINQFDYNNDTIVYSELNRSIQSLHDSSHTSLFTKDNTPAAGFTPWYDFNVTKFVVGVSTNCVSDFTIGFSGQPCQMATVQHFNNTPINSSNFPYINETWVAGGQRIYVILFDELLTIGADGSCALIR
jgi:hypothetical protein